MDEPLLGGQLVAGGNTCGQTMEESAKITAVFFEQVHTRYPGMKIGDIEPYPHFSAAELKDWVLELEKNGVSPAFFHLDVDVEQVKVYNHNVIGDLRSLAAFFEEKGIPFGVIFTSNWKAAGSDKTYVDSTMLWIRTVKNAIDKPQHIIFQSWQGPAASGAHEVPVNLPSNDPGGSSHTRLILEGLGILSP